MPTMNIVFKLVFWILLLIHVEGKSYLKRWAKQNLYMQIALSGSIVYVSLKRKEEQSSY